MRNQEANQEANNDISDVIPEEGRVWRIPELTVISVAETKSGIQSFGPGEGDFYMTSF